jgi:hypothetical protein
MKQNEHGTAVRVFRRSALLIGAACLTFALLPVSLAAASGLGTPPSTTTPSATATVPGAVQPDVGVNAGNNYLGKYGIGYITPKSQEIETGFSSDAYGQQGVISASVTFSGNSYLYWDGSPNFAPGSLINNWWVNGISVSVSFPLGLGFSGLGENASQTQTKSNGTTITENFSNIYFSGTYISSADESTGYNLTISGNAYYNPSQAQD